jgi:hypothetical protein
MFFGFLNCGIIILGHWKFICIMGGRMRFALTGTGCYGELCANKSCPSKKLQNAMLNTSLYFHGIIYLYKKDSYYCKHLAH